MILECSQALQNSPIEEFMAGNLVVKKTSRKLNQVPTDQGKELANKIGKLSNGIICITRTDSAYDRFCMTWGERLIIAHAIKDLFGIEEDESISTWKNALPSRIKRDEADIKNLEEQFGRFSVLSTYTEICNDENDQASKRSSTQFC